MLTHKLIIRCIEFRWKMVSRWESGGRQKRRGPDGETAKRGTMWGVWEREQVRLTLRGIAGRVKSTCPWRLKVSTWNFPPLSTDPSSHPQLCLLMATLSNTAILPITWAQSLEPLLSPSFLSHHLWRPIDCFHRPSLPGFYFHSHSLAPG